MAVMQEFENPEMKPAQGQLHECVKEEKEARSRTSSVSTASTPNGVAPATVPFECFETWNAQQGWVKGRNSEDHRRSAVLAFRFCAALSLAHWPACRVVLSAVRLLVACHYDVADVEVCFGMALATLRSPRSAHLLNLMGPQERVLVAMLHVYCAHSLVFDEFVHFTIWHEWLLAPFCSMKTSSCALKKVCALRKWRFVVPRNVLDPIVEELRQDVEPGCCDDSDYEGSLPGYSC